MDEHKKEFVVLADIEPKMDMCPTCKNLWNRCSCEEFHDEEWDLMIANEAMGPTDDEWEDSGPETDPRW